jgi:hypothetical protein
MLKLRKLFIALTYFPFIVAFANLDTVLSVRLFSIFGLLNDRLTDCDVEILFV